MSDLIHVEEAQARLLALKPALGSQTLPLLEAFGHYISEPVIAMRDQPAAPLSAMDGYAIRFADLPEPWTLIGECAAGSVPSQSVGPGKAMRIFTGALLPVGADTVLIQESVDRDGNAFRLIAERPAMGAHVRARASDFAQNDVLLATGSRLTPGALAAAAMAGAGSLRVGRRPSAVIVTTGDELVPPGHALTVGQIPDSNAVMLAAQLAGEPVNVSLPHHVHDDRRILSNLLKDLARHHDVIVTVGGASVGDHDHVQCAITDAGGMVEFWKVAMRPGKPLLAATLGDAVVLGLPGNPSSAFVTATLFLLPLVRHLAGAADPLPPSGQAPLAMPLAAGGQRREYLRATLSSGGLYPLVSQDSGQTRPLAIANALIIREIGASAACSGDVASYIPL